MSATTSKTLDLPLANVATGIEERRCNLICRHRDLRDKIATIERSIPALMAFNLWMTKPRDHDQDTPCKKVREIMNKLSPQPDPADKLLAELKSTVDDLHRETAQLHDKIIDADVKLEETGMELESLELANKEMEERLIELQNEVAKHSTPSLHSIHSDDLICLRKIRQLAEEELKLKNCIKELENKEITYRRQMSKLLSCKKFQRDNRKTEIEKNSKRLCPLKDRKHDAYVTKKKYTLKDKGRKTCCSCATSVTLTNYEEMSKGSSKERKKMCPPASCCIPLDNRTIKSRDYKVCCKSCQQISIFKSKSPYESSTNPSCESLQNVISKIDVAQSLKRLTQSSVPCVLGKTCKDCKTSATYKEINISECEEQSARKSSTIPCDCSITPLDKTRELTISGISYLGSEVEDSDSDEFCECCSCGCENSSI
ncbi:uncharacterized protein LOC126850381 [Cataglyphis hispanica]|uniref:uncharacterized protein LOC126850381 n=1 Tax=Cataglyphis hispanica TaxID=1086592 RepID=UPI00218067C2|nr:uncharacterized protein LOC126850381 [Cataglyphis hispanica]